MSDTTCLSVESSYHCRATASTAIQPRPTLFLNGPRRAPSLSRRNPGSSIPLLCPTRPTETSFFGGGGRWALALALAARRQSLTQSLRRLDTGRRKQQHNAELVGWFVACFFKSHAAQQRDWFGQLTISHIKQQVLYPCNHTIKHGSKVKTKRPSSTRAGFGWGLCYV